MRIPLIHCLALFSLSLAVPAAAADVVVVSVGDGGETRLSGEVLDYTGKQLVIKLPNGLQRTLPADRVLRIETQRSAQHEQADALFEQGKFEQAASLYLAEVRVQQRRWLRRELLAQAVWCQRNLNRFEAAAQLFLVLYQDDPDTPYFDCLPLSWAPRQPPAALEQRANQWLGGSPVQALLGASYLMSTSQRPAALQKLSQLLADRDERVAALAKAQTWRAKVATAGDAETRAWEAEIRRMPETLRAGPYFVLGEALARPAPQRAALAYLRVPVLYPRSRALAARCLLEAGAALDKMKQHVEAQRLYREALERFPETEEASEARGRLKPTS